MKLISSILRRATTEYAINHPHIRMKYKVIGAVAFVGFPAYFIIWKFIFEQPYENLWLRLLGSVMSLPLLLEDYFSETIKKYMPFYTYLFTIFGLPFLFMFMMLMNKANMVWQMSMMASLIYLIFLMDTLNVFIVFAIGCTIATIIYYLTETNPTITANLLYSIPVYLFILAGSILFNYSEERTRQESRMRALTAVGSSIAHEMRTPLLGIRYDASGLQDYLPRLIDAHDWAVAHGWDGEPLEPTEKGGLERAVDRISHHTAFANTMINILLMNIGEQRIDPANFDKFSMAGEVTQLLDSYPFKGSDREKIVWKPESDFIFFGSDLLMRHVFINLLKNGLRALGEARRGHIEIRLEVGQPFNRVYFRDTGTGIAEDQLPHLFEPFFTGRRDGTRVGIGLTFCQRVIESFEGTLTCRSELGEFTEFVISLPRVDPAADVVA
jgi:two-component system, CAI-1 autoinducer sensor kinase/phosphatase CqsS